MTALEFLEFCAKDTWLRLSLNSAMGYQPDERMVTGNIITEYLRHQPTGLSLVPIPHDKESSIGADIDMWVRYSKGWLRYLIQSKILNFKQNAYLKLDHQINGKQQFDILIDYCKANSAIPLYGMYNYFSSGGIEYWNCNLGPEYEQLAITVTDASLIKSSYKARGYKKSKTIHSYTQTVPMRCLVCCPLLMEDSRTHEHPINISQYRESCLRSDEEVPKSIRAILYKDVREANGDVINEIYKDVITPPKLIMCIDARNAIIGKQNRKT